MRLELRDEMRSWLRGDADSRHWQPSDERPRQSPQAAQSPARIDLERRCQDLQFQLDRALEDAAAARQRALDLEPPAKWDSRNLISSPWAASRAPDLADRLDVQASKELEKKTVTLEAEMSAAFAQAHAAKAAEESALAALSDSERRCQDGLRRMDAMLADTKELTRELAKHKHLAKGMDDLVRRHERRMIRNGQDPATPSFSEVRSRSSRRQSPPPRQVQDAGDFASTSRTDLRVETHRTAGSSHPPSLSESRFGLRNLHGAVLPPPHSPPATGRSQGKLRSGYSPSPMAQEPVCERRRPGLPVSASVPWAGSASRWREAQADRRTEERFASSR
ncbi:unnamed protein product [Symbiodinium pilosum]|uniref:Uncharacterized protein n=1 Tax=Symbiodinium pilosum TaxID=2952 RepID=A0A812TVF9_SYMPI|nr:unnamed protein product [Symbiodinium pilosum]